MSHSCNFISHTTYHPMIYLAIRFISHNCNFIPPNVNSYLTIVNLFLLILTLNVTMRFCVSHLQLHITYVFVFHNCDFVAARVSSHSKCRCVCAAWGKSFHVLSQIRLSERVLVWVSSHVVTQPLTDKHNLWNACVRSWHVVYDSEM